jgi:hypothetical protein
MAKENSEDSSMVSGATDPEGLNVVLAVAVAAASIVDSVQAEGAFSMPAM